MAISVKCPNPACGKPHSLDDGMAGRTVKCDACQKAFQVPAPAKASARVAQPPSAVPADRDPLIGSKIAHYRIESLLGQGGMGRVYKAHNTSLDKTCAIKVLPQEFAKQDQGNIDRFIREARSAAKVEHPNVLPVYFVGKVAKDYFIEMQYVDGGTLDGLMTRRGKLEVKEAAQIIRDVAMGLQAAHEKGIIHRDMKPTNVMLTSKGRVYVMDFGLAKMAESRTMLTQQGYVLGTPAYMPPEQAMGQTVDGRSDIYSLGVMFYQLITGTPPYTADSPVALLYQHQHAPIPDIAQVAPETPPVIADMIRRMMAKAPAERYQSCAEVVQELNAYLSSPDQPSLIVSASDMQGATDHRRSVLTQAKRGSATRTPSATSGAGIQKPGFLKKPGFLTLIAGAIGVVAVIVAAAYFIMKARTVEGPPAVQPPVSNIEHPAAPPSPETKSIWEDVCVATAGREAAPRFACDRTFRRWSVAPVKSASDTKTDG